LGITIPESLHRIRRTVCQEENHLSPGLDQGRNRQVKNNVARGCSRLCVRLEKLMAPVPDEFSGRSIAEKALRLYRASENG
jgi:hypothetical protein